MFDGVNKMYDVDRIERIENKKRYEEKKQCFTLINFSFSFNERAANNKDHEYFIVEGDILINSITRETENIIVVTAFLFFSFLRTGIYTT